MNKIRYSFSPWRYHCDKPNRCETCNTKKEKLILEHGHFLCKQCHTDKARRWLAGKGVNTNHLTDRQLFERWEYLLEGNK